MKFADPERLRDKQEKSQNQIRDNGGTAFNGYLPPFFEQIPCTVHLDLVLFFHLL